MVLEKTLESYLKVSERLFYMKKLNILLASFEFPPYPLAGTGMFALNLTKELKDHNVTVLTPYYGDGKQNEVVDGVNVLRVTLNSKGLPKVNRSFIDNRSIFAYKLSKYMKNMFISKVLKNRIAEEYKKILDIRVPNIDCVCLKLSGGNRQKVVLAKWLARNVDIIIFDCPTRTCFG